MNALWWLCAIGLLGVWFYTHIKGDALIQRLTGRTSRPPERGIEAILFILFCFGVGLAIAVPPINLLPQSDPLIPCVFLFLGSTIGGLSAQALFGRKVGD